MKTLRTWNFVALVVMGILFGGAQAQKYRDLIVSCSGNKNSQYWNETVVCSCSFDCDVKLQQSTSMLTSAAIDLVKNVAKRDVFAATNIPGSCILLSSSANICSECLQSIDRDQYTCEEHVVLPTTSSANRIPVCFGVPATNSSVCSGHGSCISNDVCICDFLYDPSFRNCSSAYFRIVTLFTSLVLYMGFSLMFVAVGLVFSGWFVRCLITCFCLYRLDKRLKKNVRFSEFAEKKNLILMMHRIRLKELKTNFAPKVFQSKIVVTYDAIDPKLTETIVLNLLGECDIDTVLNALYGPPPKKNKKRNKLPIHTELQSQKAIIAESIRNATHLVLTQMEDCQSPAHHRDFTVYLLTLRAAESAVNMIETLPFSRRTGRLWILLYKLLVVCTAQCEQKSNILEEREHLSQYLDTLHQVFKRGETSLIVSLYKQELDLSVEHPLRRKFVQEVFKRSSELSVSELLQEKCEKYATKIQKATAEADTWKTVYYCELLRNTLLENQQSLAVPFNVVRILTPALKSLIQNNENNFDVCRHVCRLVWEVLYLGLLNQRVVGLAMNADDRDNLMTVLENFESKFIAIPIHERVRKGDSLPTHFDRTGELGFFVDLSFQCLFLLRDTRSIVLLLLNNANVTAPGRFLVMLYGFRNQIPYMYFLHILELYSKYWVPDTKVNSLIKEKFLFNWHTRYLHIILLTDVLQNQSEKITEEQQLLIQQRILSYTKTTSRMRRGLLHVLTFPLSCCLGRESKIGKRAIVTMIHQFPQWAKMNEKITNMGEFSEDLRQSLFPNIKFSIVDRVWTTIVPRVNFLDLKLDLTQPQVNKFRIISAQSPASPEDIDMSWFVKMVLAKEEQAIFVLAAAGDGKSSLMRNLAYTLLVEHQQYGIFVKATVLASYTNQWKDEDAEKNCEILHEVVLQSLSGELESGLRTGLEITQFKIQLLRLLKRQPLYVLVDGYDEVNPSQKKAFDILLQKLRLLRGMTTNGLTVEKLVVTSRDESSVSLPSNMPLIKVELKPFNKKTHQNFLKNVLVSMPNIPPARLATIREDIKRMRISNPLLSVLLLKELVTSQDATEKAVALESQFQLYHRLLRSAVSEAKGKRVQNDTSVAILDTDYLMRAFSILAYVSYKVGESVQKIIRVLKHSESFEEIISSHNQWLKAVKNPIENFVTTLIAFSTLTVNQSARVAWSHRSIQHFFVAKFLTDTDRQIIRLRSMFNANPALRSSLADRKFLDDSPEVVKLIFSRFHLDRSVFYDPLLAFYSVLGKKVKLKASLHNFLFTTIPTTITQYPSAEQPLLLEYLAQSMLQATHMNARRVYELMQQMSGLPDELSIYFRDIPYLKESSFMFGHSFVNFVSVLKDDRQYFIAGSGCHLYVYHIDKKKYSATVTHDSNFTAARSLNTKRGWLVGDDNGDIYEFDQFNGLGKPRYSVNEFITTIQVSSDDSRLVVGTKVQENNTIQASLYLPVENLHHRLPVNHQIVDLLLHTQNRIILHEATLGGLHIISEYDLTNIAERKVLRMDKDMIACSKWDQIIVLGFKDGHVELFDVEYQHVVASFTPANGPATTSADGQVKVQHYSKAIQNLHVLNPHVLILLYDRRTIFIRDWMNRKHSEFIWKRAIFNVRSVIVSGSGDIDILFFDRLDSRLNRAIVLRNITEDITSKSSQPIIVSPQPQLRALNKRTVGDIVNSVRFSDHHIIFKTKKFTITPCISSYCRTIDLKKKNPILGYYWDENCGFTFTKDENKLLQFDLKKQEVVAEYPLDVLHDVQSVSWIPTFQCLVADESHKGIRLYDTHNKILTPRIDLKMNTLVPHPVIVLGADSPFMVILLEADGMLVYSVDSATGITRISHLLQGQVITAVLCFPVSRYKVLVSLQSGDIHLYNFSSSILTPEVRKFVYTQSNVGAASNFDVLTDESHFLSMHSRKSTLILWNVEHRQAIYSFNVSCSFVCLGEFQEKQAGRFPCVLVSKKKTSTVYDLNPIFSGEESLRQFQHIVPLSSTSSRVKKISKDTTMMTELIMEVREMKSLMQLLFRRQNSDSSQMSESSSQGGHDFFGKGMDS
eukprot:CAMPEP_0117440202 /NCGR_PEP_ID=MMETSP0759-20121206/2962_1 /TAXON_ID=63605 /ORGANISM="Percolomonas cosmopolitus, Strain WS" /LENGTH=2051 /DNA_ID=CAMNT_0005231947 /DNA_START=59 /DNA_END=6214 /DNA_ORIENTATION=-